MWPAHGNRSIVFGSRLSMTIALVSAPRTIRARVVLPTPTRHWSASSRFASVADSAHVRSPGHALRRRASASSVCTPRLDDSSSCHSSTTIAARPAKRSRQSARARNSVRLSGVVTRAVGSRLLCFARAPAAVSPVRTSTVQCGRSAAAAEVSARPVSAASARNGVIHSSVRGGGRVGAALRPRTSGPTAAAGVLPIPVGACSDSGFAARAGAPDFFLERKRRHPAHGEPRARGGVRIAVRVPRRGESAVGASSRRCSKAAKATVYCMTRPAARPLRGDAIRATRSRAARRGSSRARRCRRASRRDARSRLRRGGAGPRPGSSR